MKIFFLNYSPLFFVMIKSVYIGFYSKFCLLIESSQYINKFCYIVLLQVCKNVFVRNKIRTALGNPGRLLLVNFRQFSDFKNQFMLESRA